MRKEKKRLKKGGMKEEKKVKIGKECEMRNEIRSKGVRTNKIRQQQQFKLRSGVPRKVWFFKIIV